MLIDVEHVNFIDGLRVAAKQHRAVFDLLQIIDESIAIDDTGNREILNDKSSISFLKAAQMAAVFALQDYLSEADPNAQE